MSCTTIGIKARLPVHFVTCCDVIAFTGLIPGSLWRGRDQSNRIELIILILKRSSCLFLRRFIDSRQSFCYNKSFKSLSMSD
ncbi:hypothetical protein ILYODFUR_015079 [Ilyodon furcidens]|uniref:Uncharacterized protein n=1 Tax=Ilyodon furcidens TaxID=33524 RepID=A0ABV0TV10_9TELE